MSAAAASAAAAITTTAALTPRSALPCLSAEASCLPETSLRSSSSSLSACRPRWRAWSLMLVMTLCAVATATSAVSNVKWIVQSNVMAGLVTSSSTLKMVECGQRRPASGYFSSPTMT